LKLILVEGGEGNVGLAYLRDYGPPENRRHIAEKYLKLGILSGEEYLDIVSDHPLILWGVEQDERYQDNVQAFLEAERRREEVRPVVAALRQAVEALKPRLTPEPLRALDEQAKAYAEERLPLADYVDELLTLAASTSIPTDSAYPNAHHLRQVHWLEQDMDMALVQQEQATLLERLARVAKPEALDALVAKARQTDAREQFYEALEQTARQAGSALEAYPNLSRYLTYLKHSRALRPAELAQELDRLAAQLRQRLAASSEARLLLQIETQLDLVEKLLGLALSPSDYERLHAISFAGTFPAWAEFLNSQSVRQGLPLNPFKGLDELEHALPTLQRFYEVAHTREEALVARALAKLDETRESLAVLITGGFHSPEITKRLIEQGLGVVVVAPKVSQPTNERLYHAVLKYKSGHGSFKDVEDAAVLISTAGRAGQGGIRQ